MAVKVYKPGEQPRSYRRFGLYGPPKIGKTRLVTSLPWGSEFGWGNKAAYVAWDPGSDDWEMSPVLISDREHLIMAKPEPEEVRGKLLLDPYETAIELACMDWRKVDPEIETLIWDTMTSTSENMRDAVAQEGRYGNSITFGKSGTKSHLVHAQQGDYGAAQMMTQHIIDFLFDQPLNIIVLFHQKATDPDDIEQVGGPATVGKAGIVPMAKRFDNLLRIAPERTRIGEGSPPKYETRRVVYTEPHGVWLAGMRSPRRNNPMSKYTLTDNTRQFWIDLHNNARRSD